MSVTIPAVGFLVPGVTVAFRKLRQRLPVLSDLEGRP